MIKVTDSSQLPSDARIIKRLLQNSDGTVYQNGTEYFYSYQEREVYYYIVSYPEWDEYSYPTDQMLDEYCIGSTHNAVYHNGEGDVTITETIESDSCKISGYLDIVDLDITHETVIGENDGSVKIEVETNLSTIHYSIDNFVTYNTTGVFTGLPPGDYIAYASDDERRYEDSAPFTILPGATVDPRWQIDYTDLLGGNTEIKIFKDGYEGQTEFLKGAGSPLLLSYSGRGGDLYTPISSLQASINFLAYEDFKFDEIYQADEKEFRVEIYKDGAIKFKGYLLPDVYQEPYLYPPFEVNLTATDGLGLLKNFSFSSLIDTQILGEKSIINVISLMLGKTGLSLPIVSHVNLFSDGMDTSVGADPLEQAFVNSEIFIKEDGTLFDSISTIETILFAFNARLYQEDGKWHIVRINEAGDVRDVREYNSKGVKASNYTFGEVKNLTRPNVPDALHWIEKSQILTYRPAHKSVKTTYQTGGRRNFVPDGFFEQAAWNDDLQLKHWTGTMIYSREKSELEPWDGYKEIEYDVVISNIVSSISYSEALISKAFYMDMEMPAHIFYYIDTDDEVDAGKTNPQLYFELECGGYFYSYSENGWTTTPTYNNTVESASANLKLNEYVRGLPATIPAPPSPGMATVRIYDPVSGGYNINHVRLAQFALYSEGALTAHREVLTKTYENDRNFSENQDNTIVIGDAYFKNVLTGSMRVGDEYTTSWNGEGFHVRHAEDRFENLSKSRQLLSGSIRGKLKFSDTLYDPNNADRYFLCLGFTHDDKMCTYEGDWHEINTKNTPDYLIDHQGNYTIDYEGFKVRDY